MEALEGVFQKITSDAFFFNSLRFFDAKNKLCISV